MGKKSPYHLKILDLLKENKIETISKDQNKNIISTIPWVIVSSQLSPNTIFHGLDNNLLQSILDRVMVIELREPLFITPSNLFDAKRNCRVLNVRNVDIREYTEKINSKRLEKQIQVKIEGLLEEEEINKNSEENIHKSSISNNKELTPPHTLFESNQTNEISRKSISEEFDELLQEDKENPLPPVLKTKPKQTNEKKGDKEKDEEDEKGEEDEKKEKEDEKEDEKDEEDEKKEEEEEKKGEEDEEEEEDKDKKYEDQSPKNTKKKSENVKKRKCVGCGVPKDEKEHFRAKNKNCNECLNDSKNKKKKQKKKK
jgi:hypothetical protein